MPRRIKNKKVAGVWYRSGYEASIAEDLIRRGVEFDYESVCLNYSLPNKMGECGDCGGKNTFENRTYTPDFILHKGPIVEAKGRFLSKDRTKMLHVIKSNPGLDIRMLLQYDNWLTKAKKTKYSRWCERNNIKYAIGKIPEEWTA